MLEKLNKTDIEILRLLQQNSNRTIKNIADLLGMTTTPVFDRIKKLEKRGYISKYAAILDSKKLGLKLTVFAGIALKSHTRSYLEKFVKTIEGFPVTRCWQYEETSRCVGRENNYCQTFEDNRGCEEQYGKCLEQANVSKICKNFEKKFKCGDKLEENAEIKHVDTEYLVKRDERDLSNCTESDLKHCVIEHEECLEPAETRNINGKDVFKECWKWDRQYYCKQNSFIDECKDLKARCKEKSRECISYDKEKNCEHWDVNFECEEKSADKVDCIGSKFCL